MATQINTTMLDDLALANKKEVVAEQSIQFALDGVLYKVDLTAANAKKFRDFLTTYTNVGTKLGFLPKNLKRTDTDIAAAREWALSRNLKVATRGRVPQEILNQYNAEMAKKKK